MNLTEHLATVISTLNEAGIDYALCGGLALAVHGHPRFTADIDLLVHPDDIEKLLESVRPLGFVIPAQPMVMTSSEGSIEIRRISAADEQQLVTLDILLVGEATQAAWDSRRVYDWEHGQLRKTACVISNESLIDHRTRSTLNNSETKTTQKNPKTDAAVDMSSSAITKRLRLVDELVELGRSLTAVNGQAGNWRALTRLWHADSNGTHLIVLTDVSWGPDELNAGVGLSNDRVL